PEEKLASKKKFGLNGPTVLYAGRLAPEKHVDVLIKALALAKETIANVNLVITGSGMMEKNLKRLAQDLGISQAVNFMGFVAANELPEIYGACDIFAVTSTAETQCLSMMNAMAAGLPCLGVNAGALPEYIGEQNGFVVEPGDVKALAAHIVTFCKHPELAESIGKKAHEYVQQFSIPKIVDVWIELFNEYSSR
ncbi:MAG TPA: glycosyltransferase family 4 protein, partial [Candidatus Limnocylindria bacterium]|nr:glycosyltransferase family 4 protein [Candidatus Limnocylindria bacterium]